MSDTKKLILDKFGKLADGMDERGRERLLDIGEGMAIMREITAADEPKDAEPQAARG